MSSTNLRLMALRSNSSLDQPFSLPTGSGRHGFSGWLFVSPGDLLMKQPLTLLIDALLDDLAISGPDYGVREPFTEDLLPPRSKLTELPLNALHPPLLEFGP